jgi:hypothetical protein
MKPLGYKQNLSWNIGKLDSVSLFQIKLSVKFNACVKVFDSSSVSGLMRFCDGSDKGTASNFVKISEMWHRNPGNDRQALGEECSPNSPRPKKKAR